MSISIREAFGQNLNNPNIPISSKRLNKILKSTSLEEATSMGLIDRLFDRFFRNGGKRETITRLYEQVASVDAPSLENTPGLKMGLRFDRLRQLANEEYRDEFKTRVIKSSSDEWSFSFGIGNHVIYQSDWLSRKENEDCFQALCAIQIIQEFEDDLYPDNVLKQALLEGNYVKEELCYSDVIPETDTHLIYITQVYKQRLMDLLDVDTDGLNGDSLDTLKAMLSLRTVVDKTDTSLCQLFEMKEPELKNIPTFVHNLLIDDFYGK